jgi:hypothetical protein
MRSVVASFSVLTMALAFVFGISGAMAAPLTPGKPAGVKQAQDRGLNPAIYVAGLGAIGIGIGLAVSGNDIKVVSATSTTGTP